MNNHDLLVPRTMKVIDAMKVLDQLGKKIIFVADADRKLEGSVTDGDIRRFIIKNGDLNTTIDYVMNTNPIALKKSKTRKKFPQTCDNYLFAVPVIDEERIIHDILLKDEFQLDESKSHHLNIPVVIMAGGEGKRLLPYTKILPKPLIPIGDIPIVERIINNFFGFGMRNFHLILNYKKNMVMSYFNDLDKAYNVSFIEEKEPLGTVGGLVALKDVLESTFFVSNCDVLVLCDYEDIYKFHKEYENDITVVTSLKSHRIPYGVIEVSEEGTINKINEKPTYNVLVNTGMYICEASVMDDLPANQKFDMTDLIDKYIQSGKRVGTYPVSEDAWLDMGEMEEMDRMLNRLEIHRFST